MTTTGAIHKVNVTMANGLPDVLHLSEPPEIGREYRSSVYGTWIELIRVRQTGSSSYQADACRSDAGCEDA